MLYIYLDVQVCQADSIRDQTTDFVKFLGIVIILFCGFLTSKAFFGDGLPV